MVFFPYDQLSASSSQLSNDCHNALDAGYSVHALFFDVSKAFDRVDHSLLVERCKSIGLTGPSLQWIKSYLQGRSIVTSVEGQLSVPECISSRVPQGSVLGPLFFVIYFSSLPSAIQESTPVMFADDTLVYNTKCGGKKAHSQDAVCTCCSLQADANTISTWPLSGIPFSMLLSLLN